jgi:RNA polymerase sigma-70 factor (ECF subfamily)
MDELTLLRKVHEDVAEPTPEAMGRGRAALFEHIAAPTTTRNKRRRGIRIAGLSALGASVVVTALVLTNVLGFAGWRGGADGAAAEALHAAALATIKTIDPVVAPGQYLLVHTTAVNLAQTGDNEGNTASLLFETNDDLYIPADRSDDWIWSRQPSTPYQTFGPKSEAIARDWTDDRLGDSVELLQAKAGAFYGGAASASFGDLAGLPRDPTQLLNYIYRVTLGQGPSPDGEALVYIADRLRLGIVQADLRAAFYEAAARIPGVEITEQEATLDGRTGVAFGRNEGGIFRQEIIVDPATGQFIGERTVLLIAQDEVPPGTTSGWSAVATSVVDSAPRGGTPNGAFDVMGCISDGKGGSQCPTN